MFFSLLVQAAWRAFSRACEHGEQNRRQDGDDRNHDQQLNQRKAVTATRQRGRPTRDDTWRQIPRIRDTPQSSVCQAA
jgi:hypothetical protein